MHTFAGAVAAAPAHGVVKTSFQFGNGGGLGGFSG
jgi:hypothetical protein